MTINEIILHHTKEMLSQTSIAQAQFLCEYVYPELAKRGIEKPQEITSAEHYTKWVTAKQKQMNCVLNGKTAFPLKWLETWMECLPEPYKSACRKDVLAALGVMDIKHRPMASPEQEESSQRSNLAQLLRETAEVLEAGSSVMADGKYDQHDSPEHLESTANELYDLVDLCTAEIMAINCIRPVQGRAKVVVQMYK